jgi:hypothetical protein
MDDAKLRALIDRDEIRETIVRFATSLDQKDWRRCRSCFAEEIFADYSDLRGDPPSTVGADDFVELRRQALSGLSTHHVSTNHLIEVNGDEASCTSSMVIYRRLTAENGHRVFDTHCLYIHKLIRTLGGWKIRVVKQQVFWNTGDPMIHTGAKGKGGAG